MIQFDNNTMLNDRIIQQLYRIKTIDRNSEWDVIWYLGGKNQVTLGEKAGNYYLLPPEDLEMGEERFMGMDKVPGDRNLVGEGTVLPTTLHIKNYWRVTEGISGTDG